ncbi:MAG: PKD domain-containing protein [Leptolyngbya sp. SIO1D8]|nr:PKD domain-containing protein [Leptolyngbya sp. SIO1D8]
MERKTYVDGNTVAVLIDGPIATEINNSVTFYVSDPFDYGITTFHWQMDDGSTYSTTNRSVTHTYTVEGVKMVTVSATNSEANFSVSGSRGISIKYVTPTIPPLSVGQITPTTVSTTTCSTTLTFSATASGSCNSNYSYSWRYRDSGGSWISFDPATPTEFTHAVDTSLEVEVRVTNPSCGNEMKIKSLQLFYEGCYDRPIDY